MIAAQPFAAPPFDREGQGAHAPRATGARADARALYGRFAALVRDEIGVKLPPTKQLMVESRLRRRMINLGYATVQDYFQHLFAEGGLEAERDVIFDAVTTNKTDFFREISHFEILAKTVLPAAHQRRRTSGGMTKIWSAAASTGAEAYTMAMVSQLYAEATPGFGWGVLGTDINTEVLRQACTAVYSTETIAPVPPALREQFLMRGEGEQSGSWRIVPELRRRTQFQRLNLMETNYPIDRDLDVIFLRNVLIYFGPEDQTKVIGAMADHLVRGGHFFVGHSESMVVRDARFTQIAPAVFVRS
ncbi:CheR family methyltransferase [Phaeovulum sp. W22_SRMD_FR3]|uniref:CheR family methyltransferase n=1 Tax=Phaeovulum sp. W22_SRMD_FR3 TaxID=3240274 RepID=UPI003F95955C